MPQSRFPARVQKTLKSLWREFRRCSMIYLPLYHEKLFPWAEDAVGLSISNEEWSAFMAVHPEPDDSDEWWAWDGPHRNWEWEPNYLGRYFGCPDGIREFTALAESACNVLMDIGLNELPPLTVSADWTWLLHEIAFRHKPILLESDMTLWATDEALAGDDFFEAMEIWDRLEDGFTKWPRHPMVLRLSHSVYISSMTAIQVLLTPESVITTNDSFDESMIGLGRLLSCRSDDPILGSESARRVSAARSPIADETTFPADQAYSLVRMSEFWHIYFEDESGVFEQKGFEYLARCFACPNVRLRASDFLISERNGSAIYEASSPDAVKEAIFEGKLSSRTSAPRRVKSDIDKVAKQQETEWLDKLRTNVEQAQRDGDLLELHNAQAQLREAEQTLRQDDDRGSDHATKLRKNAQDRVRIAIDRALHVLQSKGMPKLASHVSKYLDRTDGYLYTPPDNIRWLITFAGHSNRSDENATAHD